MVPYFSMKRDNRFELIQELFSAVTNEHLRKLIEYKNTLMAAQLAQDIAMLASETTNNILIEEPEKKVKESTPTLETIKNSKTKP